MIVPWNPRPPGRSGAIFRPAAPPCPFAPGKLIDIGTRGAVSELRSNDSSAAPHSPTRQDQRRPAGGPGDPPSHARRTPLARHARTMATGPQTMGGDEDDHRRGFQSLLPVTAKNRIGDTHAPECDHISHHRPQAAPERSPRANSVGPRAFGRPTTGHRGLEGSARIQSREADPGDASKKQQDPQNRKCARSGNVGFIT